jgi:hypothetical protein
MYKVALACGDKIISIDTDSVTAMCPVDVPESKALGDWHVKQYAEGIFFQNGIYWLSQGDEWMEGHSRGVSEVRGQTGVPADVMLESIRTGIPITLKRRTQYTTLRMALNGVGHAGEWTERKGTELRFGGTGKRSHRKRCNRYCHDEVHAFIPPSVIAAYLKEEDPVGVYESDPWESEKHKLPWKDKDYDSSRDEELSLARDIVAFQPKRENPDEAWAFQLPEAYDPEEFR